MAGYDRRDDSLQSLEDQKPQKTMVLSINNSGPVDRREQREEIHIKLVTVRLQKTWLKNEVTTRLLSTKSKME